MAVLTIVGYRLVSGARRPWPVERGSGRRDGRLIWLLLWLGQGGAVRLLKVEPIGRIACLAAAGGWFRVEFIEFGHVWAGHDATLLREIRN
jgi:hypothetical protein